MASTLDVADDDLSAARSGSDDDASTALRPAPVARNAGSSEISGPSSTSSGDPARQRFEERFPAQAKAGQDASRDPASTRWAVLVGINEHHGNSPRSNLTSRQDAESLHRHLRSLGWKEENIVLLRDREATREMIQQSIAWLARKTNGNSLAVFHFSGHMRSWNHHTGRPDVALWPSDSNFLPAGEFARRLGAVRSGWMWVNIQACHAESMNVDGLRRAGRVLTFSSRAPEKSYEDPERGHTVLGHYLIKRGMIDAIADRDRDGDVTIQEAFHYAAPRATERTSRASHGPQRPALINDAGRGGFSLRIPPAPQGRQEPEAEDDGRTCLLMVCRP